MVEGRVGGYRSGDRHRSLPGCCLLLDQGAYVLVSVADPFTMMPDLWHGHGMPRVRVSTTVDEHLIGRARRARSDLNDAALLDEALAALLARYRAAAIDAGYSAYDDQPIDGPDEWGDLGSFREAAAGS